MAFPLSPLRPLVVLALAFGPLAARAEPTARFYRANFHAHCSRDEVDDDGAEAPQALHEALRERGFDFSLHTPHSTLNVDAEAAGHWLKQRAKERRLDVGELTIAVGEELTVADGPRFQQRTRVLGHDAPGNLNHLALVGITALIPSQTPLAEACDRVHAMGGVCIVNHAGPGPMMWEEGLWESRDHRGKIDGLEVYNGQALSAIGLDFEARYREATAYGGLGLQIAATTGADTHGPLSAARARNRVAGFGVASKVLKLLLAPPPPVARPELEAATLVFAPSASEPDIVEAVRQRRTIATFNLKKISVTCPGLGEIRRSREVSLKLGLGRKVEEITLYREGAPVRTWRDVSEVNFVETISRPAAYVFGVRDGSGRLLTSAIWYEPK